MTDSKAAVLVAGAEDDYESEKPVDEVNGCDGGEELDENDAQPFDPRRVNVSPVPLSIHSILARIRSGRICMDPDFQRNGGIWTQRAKVRLIESLLIRLPLPAFYFDATDDDHWIVIDGLQRLTAIKEFVIDQKWPLKKDCLEFLKKQCAGKYFDDLSLSFQGNVEESQIVACKILQGTPPRVKFDIFRRINTGGLPLNPQEIRHALNVGEITEFLKSLAQEDSFLAATGRMNSKRMNDRECVLRFLAFYETDPLCYKNHDFDRFLNEYMAGFNSKCKLMSQDERERYKGKLRAVFVRAMDLAIKVFGDDAFRKRYELASKARYQVNKALFEAWAVNLAHVEDECSRDVLARSRERLVEMFVNRMNTPEFDSSVSQSTANAASVRCRFETVKAIIQEVLHA